MLDVSEDAPDDPLLDDDADEEPVPDADVVVALAEVVDADDVPPAWSPMPAVIAAAPVTAATAMRDVILRAA